MALGYDRVPAGEVFGNDDYLRVGDSSFAVPPTCITVHDKTNNHIEDVLRTPGGLVMANGFSEKEITIELKFTSSEEIFGLKTSYALLDAEERRLDNGRLPSPPVDPASLAALLAQFKRTPIVPVVNNYLNVGCGISAVALTSLMAETWIEEDGTPLPNAMKVTLQCMAFAYEAFCPSIIDFDSAVMWPIFRWNWRQAYSARLPGEHTFLIQDQVPTYPSFTPLERKEFEQGTGQLTAVSRFGHQGMSGEYQFSIVARSWLEQLNRLRDEYVKLQAYALSDDFRHHVDRNGRANAFGNLQQLASAIQTLSGEQYARMDVQDLGPDMVLTHLAAQITNNFVPLRLPNTEVPAYQHMSQGDVRLIASFWCTNEASIFNINRMIEQARDLARDSRFEMVAGFVGFQNEIASLFGVQAVVFTDVQSRPVEGLPGNFLVSIEMIAFDRQQRKIETVNSTANGGTQWYLDQNPTGVSGEIGNTNWTSEPQAVFWQRYRSSLDPSHDPKQPSGSDSPVDSTGRPVNAWFNMAYIQEAKEHMAALELYPDLRLPTWERLEAALTGGEIFDDPAERDAQYQMQYLRWAYWGDKGRFVDPDFYVDYPNRTLASKLVITGTEISSASSYLAHAIAGLEKLDATLALHVDGSVSGAMARTIFDSFPAGALYGPDPTTTTNNMAGEAGWARGDTHVHGLIDMPSHTNKTETSVFRSVFHELGNTQALEINGKTYNVKHPEVNYSTGGGVSPDYDEDPKAFSKIPTVQDQMNKAVTVVKGEDPSQERISDLTPALMAHHPMDIGARVGDEHGRVLSTCADLFNHDQTGRLVQAYPAYVMQLVDEGPRMGWVKIFPNFFALQSVQSIDIIEDRREPAATAIIELMNTYGNLSSYTQLQQNLAAYTSVVSAGNTFASNLGTFTGDAVGGLSFDPAAIENSNKKMAADLHSWWEGMEDAMNVFIPSENLINNVVALRKKQSGQVMLAPGVRVHLRMGYGGNGASFPVLFNGRITDLGFGERVRVVAMGDGLELDKLIPTAESETNSINRPDRGFIQNLVGNGGNPFTSKMFEQTYEPREIICNMLNSHGEELFDYGLTTKFWNWMKSNIRVATNGGAYADNPIGITHFGNPYLFNLWNAIAGKGLDGIPGDGSSELIIKHAQALDSWTQAKDAKHPDDSLAMRYLAYSLTANDPFNPVAFPGQGAIGMGSEQLVRAGDFLGNITPDMAVANPALATAAVSGIALKLLGEGACLLTHQIPTGYGETGENVYAIYTPFSQQMREMGSFMSEHGMGYLSGGTAANIDPSLPGELPSLESGNHMTPLQGAHPPGVTFNMYTKNKTVWDVCTAMAQYFPPYIAAVRPFEYRSTLFFGAPYFTYRYDYARLSSAEIGAKTQYDKFFGYPVAYKTKPFSQFHIYDSRVNLLDNDIRASDEETFTDVIAMWYKGQGMSGGRPEPKPVHQTVDRAIAPAFKKTAIVNTDIVGLDIAPTKAAIIGSGGLALLNYWAVHFIKVPFTDIGISGGLNHWLTEDNVRHMARAILRDYQKLMYQGHILVIGDPSAKPHDIAYINDDYQDIRGPIGMRRVIHHFGFETGFVTSIEPDLAVEVKDHPFWGSFFTWMFGFGATSATMSIGASVLAAKGARKFARSALGFGLKMKKSYQGGIVNGNFFGKLLQKTPLTRRLGVTIAGKPIEVATPRFLVGFMRKNLLDSFAKILSGSNPVAQAGARALGSDSATYAALVKELSDALKGITTFGQRGIDEAAALTIRTQIDAILENVLSKDGAEIVARNLFSKGGSTLSVELADVFVKRGAADFIVTKGIERFIQGNSKSLDLFTKSPIGFSGAKVAAALKALRTASTSVTELKEASVIVKDLFSLGMQIIGVAKINPIGLAFQLTVGYIWTGISRWWDDETSLQMCFLTYRGQELQSGLNGHQDAIVLKPHDDAAPKLMATLTPEQMVAFQKSGMFKMDPMVEHMIESAGQPVDALVGQSADATLKPAAGGRTGFVIGTVKSASVLPNIRGKFSPDQRRQILSHHGVGAVYGPATVMQEELVDHVDDRVFALLQALTTNGIKVAINAVGPISHPSGKSYSLHWKYKAIDIGAVAHTSDSSWSVIGSGATPPALGNEVIRTAIQAGAGGVGLNEYLDAGTWSAGKVGSTVIFRDAPGHIHLDWRT